MRAYADLESISDVKEWQWIGKLYQKHVDDHLVKHFVAMLEAQRTKRLGMPIDLYEHGRIGSVLAVVWEGI